MTKKLQKNQKKLTFSKKNEKFFEKSIKAKKNMRFSSVNYFFRLIYACYSGNFMNFVNFLKKINKNHAFNKGNFKNPHGKRIFFMKFRQFELNWRELVFELVLKNFE